jgi:hypothetical protein
MDYFVSSINEVTTGKIYNTREKILNEKEDEIVENLKKEMENLDPEDRHKLQLKIDRFEAQKDKRGKEKTFTSILDAVFNFIRIKGLGWNVSGAITNSAEGFMANQILAAKGIVKPEHLDRANNIVMGSFFKNITFGTVKPTGAVKARVLMDRYRILQDAANELQKASRKSSLSNLSQLEPFTLTSKAEYLNQTPLMISHLLDIEIVGKNGETSNLWDAMDEKGFLTENFRTEENIENWEKGDGTEYKVFKTSTMKSIVVGHGDYDQLRGNMATEYISGKALFSFKRWMPRQFVQRFAKEQPDLELGIKDFKGSYRSHTMASGAFHGALVGFAGLGLLGAGPLGLAIGAVAGGGLAGAFGTSSKLGLLKEMAIVARESMLAIIRVPVNTLTGKPTIRHINLSGLNGELSDRDLKNMQANIMDMAFLLTWIGAMLFTKALLWDDDDEEDSTRRQMHNLFANRFMQLAGQASMYLNPVEMYNSTVGNMALLRFVEDVGKTATEAAEALEGRDVIQAGPNAGESAFYNQFEKTFFPSLIKTDLGFEKQMQKQVKKSAFDTWFYGDEKKAKQAVKRIRADYREKLENQGITDKKELNKLVNKAFPGKKEDEKSYVDVLKRYEN